MVIPNLTLQPNNRGRISVGFFSARQADGSPKPVLRRLMLPLTAGLIMLGIGFAFYMVTQQNSRMNESSRALLNLISIDLQQSLAEESRSLAMFEDSLIQNAGLREALKARDRQRLLAAYSSSFAWLKADYEITHFYFMDSERVCLLRLHNPGRYGDRIERFTVQEAERTGKTASGIELGPLGTFTLRVVHPVFENDTLIGYLELGREIEDIFVDIQKHPGIELAATIHKNALIREDWESGMKMLGRDHNWERFADAVLIYSSLSPFPAEAERFVGDAGHVHLDTAAEARINGAAWQIMNTPLHDASGAVVGDLMLLRDISALKTGYHQLVAIISGGTLIFIGGLLGFLFVLLRRADAGILAQQAALRESENKFRSIIETSQEWIWALDASARHTYSNPAVENILGYTSAELLEQDVLKLLHEEDALKVKEMLPVFIAQRKGWTGLVLRWRHKDGSYRFLESNSTPVFSVDGAVAGFWGADRDITERRQAVLDLQRIGDEMHVILQSAGEGIFGADLEGRVVFANNAAVCMLGWERDEMLGQMSHELFHHTRSDETHYPRTECPIYRTAADGQQRKVQDEQFWRKNGTGFSVKYVASPRWENGRIVGTVVVFEDISDCKQAEEQIRQNLKEKETLLREIHHRVKNNMAVISGLLDLQSARVQDNTMKALFDESRQRIKSMALVHEQLYNQENLSRIDFHYYINSIVKELAYSYHREGREIIRKISVKHIMLDIDIAIPCGLIINELVTNTLKYAFPKMTGGEISISFAKSDSTYTLIIKDNGIGLPEGFDHTKTNTLGLQLVEALTRQLKGTLQFQSGTAVDHGTVVTITFSEKDGGTRS